MIVLFFFGAFVLRNVHAEPGVFSEKRVFELVDGLEKDFKGAQDRALRNRLGQELDSFGEQVVPILKQLFAGSGDAVRKSIALTGLSNILKEGSVPYLAQGLENHDAEVRLQSVYLISRYRSAQVYEALVRLVESESDPDVLKLAMWSIAEFRSAKAMEFLTGKLRDMDPKKREAAIGVFKGLFQ